MKKISAADLIAWNGIKRTLTEFIESLEKKPHLDDKHSKLLSDLIVAHNNFVSASEEEYDFDTHQ